MVIFTVTCSCFQEFKEIWSKLDLILDGGVLGLTEQCRKGSTVVNLSVPGKFSIIREGRYMDILFVHGQIDNFQ